MSRNIQKPNLLCSYLVQYCPLPNPSLSRLHPESLDHIGKMFDLRKAIDLQ